MESEICNGVLANPDISGIGIRCSFYAMAILDWFWAAEPIVLYFISHLMRQKSQQPPFDPSVLPRSNLTAAQLINGGSLLVSGVIQAALGRLTLFDAVIIIHMLVFLSMMIWISPFDTLKPLRIRLLSNLCVYSHLALAIYVAAAAPGFGAQPECNHAVKYVFFFYTVKAVSPWIRFFAISVCSFLIAEFICFTIVAWKLLRAPSKSNIRHETNIQWTRRQLSTPDKITLATLFLPFSKVFVTPIFLAIGIATLEQTISQNNVPDDQNIWSFGQVVALALLFGPLSEFYDDRVEPVVQATWIRIRYGKSLKDAEPTVDIPLLNTGTEKPHNPPEPVADVEKV